MIESEIESILGYTWVPKAGKYIVRLGHKGEPAEKAWMTEKQLGQLEAVFAKTPRGHSSSRLQVVGVYNDRGYYMYSRLEKQPFTEPVQYDLKDLVDE